MTAPANIPKLGRNKPTARERALIARLPNLADITKNVITAQDFQAPPLARYWSTNDGTPYGMRKVVSMFANDRLGDCTVATLAHQDQIAAQEVGEVSPITEADVIELYKRSGYDPRDPSSDQGWGNLDAARAALDVGWVTAIAHFDATNRTLLEIVVNDFGYAMVGIDLPLSAQRQLGPGKIWDVAPDGSLDGDRKPGSWGGHAAGVIDCDADGVTIATWGGVEQRASWPFVASYFDPGDGFALFNRFWKKRPLSPSGLYLQELEVEIARLNLTRIL